MIWAVVFIGSALFALQQLSGINAVFYFSSTVFKSAGVPSDIANICIGIVNLTGMESSLTFMFLPTVLSLKVRYTCGRLLINLLHLLTVGSIIAMTLMDRLGRKVLLLWSFFGMVIDMFFSGVIIGQSIMLQLEFILIAFIRIFEIVFLFQACSMFSQVLAAVSFIPDSAKVYLSVGGILMWVIYLKVRSS